MSVLLFGATGRIGPHVARELVSRGVAVAALVRDPSRAAAVLPAGVALLPGDFDDDTPSSGRWTAHPAAAPHAPRARHGRHSAAAARWAARAGTRVVKISGTSSAIRADAPRPPAALARRTSPAAGSARHSPPNPSCSAAPTRRRLVRTKRRVRQLARRAGISLVGLRRHWSRGRSRARPTTATTATPSP